MLTFKYRTLNKTVTFKTEDIYTIEANEFSIISPILEYFIFNLKTYYTETGIKDFKINFILNGDSIKLILHTFLKSIENHSKERIKMKSLEVSFFVHFTYKEVPVFKRNTKNILKFLIYKIF